MGIQTLGLVHGDHLHQPRIAFQAQCAVFVLLIGGPQDLGVVVHQGVLAIQLQAVLLQQLGNVQDIGEASLPVGPLQQPARHLEIHQEAAQGGQYAWLCHCW